MVAKKIFNSTEILEDSQKKSQNTDNEMDNLIKKKHSGSIQKV